MLRYITDSLLSFLQVRCTHPGEMVAVDILEGCGDGTSVSYCRRCGAVRTSYERPFGVQAFAKQPQFLGVWRSPNPHLWRGR